MIGKKYAQNKAQLKEKIIREEVETLEEKAGFHCCYFCVKPIRGEMTTLIDGDEKYHLHGECYDSVKKFYN